jgi:fucose 4-O-acetylase-like acetyltransferase
MPLWIGFCQRVVAHFRFFLSFVNHFSLVPYAARNEPFLIVAFLTATISSKTYVDAGRENRVQTLSKQRLEWIDILKGIGIIVVVLGHAISGAAHQAMFLFHMPLFFFLAGSLHKARDPMRMMKRSAKRLLVPYVVFMAVFFLPTLFLQEPHGGLRDVLRLATKFVYGGCYLAGFVGIVWFVTCLFATQQLVNWMCRWSRWNRFAMMALIGTLAYLNEYLEPALYLPLAANVVLAAAPLFYIGMLTKQVEWTAVRLATCFAIAVLSLVATLNGVAVPWDMKHAVYGLPVVSVIAAFAWFICLSRMSQWIAAVPIMSSMLASIGRMSLGIMFMHQIVQISLHDYGDVANDWLRGSMALAISFLISLALSYFNATRVFFLGELKRLAEGATSVVQG